MAEPWVHREEGHRLVVRTPAGVRARRDPDDPHGQEGVLEWVQRQRPDRRLTLAAGADLDRDAWGLVALADATAPDPGAPAPPAPPADDAWPGPDEGPVAGTDPTALARGALRARTVLFDPDETDAVLWVDRHHDGLPGARVERLGRAALVLRHGDEPLPAGWLDALQTVGDVDAVFEQHRPRGGGGVPARRVAGDGPARFEVVELGLRYLLDLEASPTSSGLFLDQRETRRRLRGLDLRGRTVLNTFAHTGSFSVAAALAGAEVLTLDLSRRYLAWAADNLRANGIDPADHDAVYGDALDWLDRFARRGRAFDVVLVDPPSSSTPRTGGRRWSVDRDLHDLVARAARATAHAGTLYVSTNLRSMPWPRFVGHLERGLAAAGRTATVEPQTLPLDHRSTPDDPPYLKAAWCALDP